MYLGVRSMPLSLRLVERGRKQPHLELERQHVHARGAALAAFGDDLLDEQSSDRQVDRTDDDQPAGVLAVEEARMPVAVAGPCRRAGSARGTRASFLRQRLFLLLAGQPAADVEIGLPLVAAEVQHLEGAERLVRLPSAHAAPRSVACAWCGCRTCRDRCRSTCARAFRRPPPSCRSRRRSPRRGRLRCCWP